MIYPHIFYEYLSYGVLSNFTLYKPKWENRYFDLVKSVIVYLILALMARFLF